jgi:hypothetical protein
MEKFWIYDPAVLFQNGNWNKVIPQKSMTREERYNTYTRLIIYLTIIGFIIFTRKDIIYLGIILLLIIIVLYLGQKDNNQKDIPSISGTESGTDSQDNQELKDHIRWIHEMPQSCKEKKSECLKYEDLRFNHRSL